jgi:hypothetical protein
MHYIVPRVKRSATRNLAVDKSAAMPAGLALVLLAQAAVAGTPEAPAQPAKTPAPAAQDGCTNETPKPNTSQIVICAPKPQGYRLNPDVIEAKREIRGAGRPRNPHEPFRDTPCASGVGPAPCFSAGINLIAAALTAAEMAKRLSEGKEVGSMFVTDPHPDEYHLYLMAKARREAREKEQAAAAKAKAGTKERADTDAAGAEPARAQSE